MRVKVSSARTVALDWYAAAVCMLVLGLRCERAEAAGDGLRIEYIVWLPTKLQKAIQTYEERFEDF